MWCSNSSFSWQFAVDGWQVVRNTFEIIAGYTRAYLSHRLPDSYRDNHRVHEVFIRERHGGVEYIRCYYRLPEGISSRRLFLKKIQA